MFRARSASPSKETFACARCAAMTLKELMTCERADGHDRPVVLENRDRERAGTVNVLPCMSQSFLGPPFPTRKPGLRDTNGIWTGLAGVSWTSNTPVTCFQGDVFQRCVVSNGSR